MADEVCAWCGQPIRQFVDQKTTVQEVSYHNRCYDKKLKALPKK